MKNTRPILWLLRRIRRRLPSIAVLCVAHMLGALLSVFFSVSSKNLIDQAVAKSTEGFFQACLLMGTVILGVLLCQWLQRHLRDRLAADLDRDWKKNLLHGLLHGDYEAVSHYHSGELLNRLNNDVRIANEGILHVFPSALAMLVRLAAAVAVLAALDLRLTLVVITVGSLVLLVTGLLRRRLKGLHKQVSQQEGIVSGFLQEVLEKLLMIQAMDVAQQIELQAEKRLHNRYEAQRKRKNASVAANMGVTFLSLSASFCALAWCAYRLLRGQMTFGTLTAVTQLVSQLRAPVVGLSGVLPQYIAMTASAERLMELDAVQGEPTQPEESASVLYQAAEAIRGENLVFSYDRDRILNHADFCLPKGSFAVVTGASGIGKSTLLKLLLGIYSVESGQLYLDCGDRKLPLDRNTRHLFSYVPQGNLLLSGTLRENLLLVKPDASEAEIAQAIYVSAMDEFLDALPQGLDTPIGESGAGLSEGQAQRLAIARAVLRDAPVLLLDECTSALDAETEALVLQRLRGLREKTCIAVTHRPAAIALCDWHLEVHEGKLLAARIVS